MALPLYIDNETPWDGDYGQWDTLVEEGASIMERVQSAAEPSRGYWGLRCRTADGAKAYVQLEDMGHSIELSESVFAGFWLNLQAKPANLTRIFDLWSSPTSTFLMLRLYANGTLAARALNDGGSSFWTAATPDLSALGWVFVAVEVRRGAGDGYARLYLNDELVGSTAALDNSDRASCLDRIRAGSCAYPRDSLDIHLDEFRAAAEPLTSDLRGCYNLYRGADGEAYVDYDHPVRSVLAGVATIDLHGLGHDVDRDYYYVCRAVSDSGQEEDNTEATRVRVDSLGALVGLPPNPLLAASAAKAAGGYVRVRFRYAQWPTSGYGGQASGVQVARDTGSGFDWETPEATLAVRPWGATRASAVLGPYSHGTRLKLACRAVTSAGVAGPVMRISPVHADAEGPPDVSYVEAEQAT